MTLMLHYGDPREPQGADRRGRLPAVLDAPGRNEEPFEAAGPGRARQELRPDLRRRQASLAARSVFTDPDQARQPAPPCWRSSARSSASPLLPESEFEVLKTEQLTQLEQSQLRTAAGSPSPGSGGSCPPIRRTTSGTCRPIEENIERTKDVTSTRSASSTTTTWAPSTASSRSSATSSRPRPSRSSTATFEGWKARSRTTRIERPVQPDVKAVKESIETPDKENAMYLAATSSR